MPPLHPIVVHFAVASSVVAAFALLGSRLARGARPAAMAAAVGTINLCVGALFGLLALASGIAAVWDLNLAGSARTAVSTHVKWAFFTTLTLLLLSVWRTAGAPADSKPSNLFLAVLWLCVAAVSVTAYLGGQNVYRYGIGVVPAAQAGDLNSERAAVEAWRAQRLAALTGESGWLTPIALYWLKEGENRLGRAPGNAFALDHAALAEDTGAFILRNHRVRYVAHAPGAMSFRGRPVQSLEMVSDREAHPTELLAGPLHFVLIDRSGRLGIRVRDSVSPKRSEFHGLTYFPIREDWRVHARFEPYVPARQIRIVNILGMAEDMPSPGAIVFERNGRSWRLDAVLEAPGEGELFVMFADATSGRQTYGAGRFLHVPLPVANRIDVDFNEAYNPPCAFTEFATCPLPPSQNRLALEVDAGELAYEHAR